MYVGGQVGTVVIRSAGRGLTYDKTLRDKAAADSLFDLGYLLGSWVNTLGRGNIDAKDNPNDCKPI